jgi:Spy/CpxP family protein refolding chaperone
MLLRRKSFAVAIAVFLVASTVAIANPYLSSKTLSNTSWEQPVAQMSQQAQAQEEERERVLERLNLTGAQKQQIASIRRKYSGQIYQLQETTQTAQEDLFEMMTGNESASDIRSKRQEFVELRQELGNVLFESMMEMRNVLTPEQRTQLKELMQERRENWSDRSPKHWF